MNAQRTMAAAAVAGALLVTAAAAPAAQPARDREVDRRMAAERTEQQRQLERYRALVEEYGSLMDARVSLDFPGGSAREYLDALEREVGVSNVVVRGPIDRGEMGEVRLTAVPYREALALVDEAVIENGNIYVNLEEHVAVVQVRDHPPAVAGERSDREEEIEIETLVFAFARNRSPEDSPLPLGEPTIDEAVGAVEAAAAFAEDEDLDLSVHEGTGMLFVRGAIDSLEVIARTIDALRERAERDAVREEEEIEFEMTFGSEDEEAEERAAELMEELERMELRIEELESANAELEEELDAAYERLRRRE